MDLKKIFMNDRAVSPVIGVVLMVAITVILAAAIGSSVFGQTPAKSAPQANINAKFSGYDADRIPSAVIIEHLGGDALNWDSAELLLYDVDGAEVTLDEDSVTTVLTGDFVVGDVLSIDIAEDETILKNSIYNVKIVDTLSNQIICNKELRT